MLVTLGAPAPRAPLPPPSKIFTSPACCLWWSDCHWLNLHCLWYSTTRLGTDNLIDGGAGGLVRPMMSACVALRNVCPECPTGLIDPADSICSVHLPPPPPPARQN